MPQVRLQDVMPSIPRMVTQAIDEDVGIGDISAQLIDADALAEAIIITREPGVFCGSSWVTEVFKQLDDQVCIDYLVADGDVIVANQSLCHLKGKARSLLTGERCALNFLQSLSGTATVTRHYVDLLATTGVGLLDTRKTIPGMRLAQKYAVTCGGGNNHRWGLYDAFLIKENHITACGGIAAAIIKARALAPNKLVEIEVESLNEFEEALKAQADIVMLDNFTLPDMRQAVAQNQGKVKLEVSGGINTQTIKAIAETGIDFISVGALTKHLTALDLSLRLKCLVTS